ncbi:MAG TPA: DUF883 C-terminal domain-containing protein [Burkholderiales bacterium]|nr:DUF883 C-terminal domain-containing protein [Burkholderiales bacterium]
MAETKRSTEGTIDRISQSAHDAVDKAASVAGSYADRFTAKGEQLMEMRDDWMGTARDFVRENPLQALGIAVAAGYLLHMITRR